MEFSPIESVELESPVERAAVWLAPVEEPAEPTEPTIDNDRPTERWAVTKQTRAMIEGVVAGVNPPPAVMNEASLRIHLPLLHDVLTTSASCQRLRSLYEALGLEPELVAELTYDTNEVGEPVLSEVQLVLRPRPEPETAELPNESDSSTFSGEYQLTDSQLTITAGGQPWVIELPTEATTEDERQIWRLRELIRDLLVEGDGATRETASVMAGPTDFTLTTTIYRVENGTVVFESHSERLSLDDCVSLLESGFEAKLFGSDGQPLTLDDLRARRHPPIKEEEEEEEEEMDDAIGAAEELYEADVRHIYETQVTTEHRRWRSDVIGRFDEAQLLAAPFTLTLEPPQEAGPVAEEPFSSFDLTYEDIIIDWTELGEAADAITETGVSQAVIGEVEAARPEADAPATVTDTRVGDESESERSDEVTRREVSVSVTSEVLPTVEAAKEAETNKSLDLKIKETVIDKSVVDEEEEEVEERQRAEVPARRHDQTRAATTQNGALLTQPVTQIVRHRRHERQAVRHGRSRVADLTATAQLAAFGGVSIVGPSGTPAYIINQALSTAQRHYQQNEEQGVGPTVYALVKQGSGYALICEQEEIALEETLIVTHA